LDRAWDALIQGRILYENDIGRLVELRRGGSAVPGVDEVEQP